MNLTVDHCPSPVGELTIVVSPSGVRALLWENERVGRVRFDAEVVESSSPLSQEVARQLGEYFDGTRVAFDLPLDPEGTDFQKRAWSALREIPYGETVSYGEQARRLGDVGLARAVGAANGRNPISIIVPCHRVIGSTGSLTGFAAGLDAKKFLLDHERRVAHPDPQVSLF
jgi:methylated-DNA-[protein]-cysteine S-methyltransferase